MKKEILYEFKALYRGDFRITGYTFGEGEKSICILGNTRGNEYQQIYCCSQLIHRLKELEADGQIVPGHQILVIPSGNPYGLNTKIRFWGTDHTDINRMFPGYDKGETTQRIAAGIFEAVKDYQVGVQFSSFYMKGTFMPHVRIIRTGYEDAEMAKSFGLPYVVLRNPRPFDTTTLNYNWQIWETDAYSIYTTHTENIDKTSASQAVDAILRFMKTKGIVKGEFGEGCDSKIIDDNKLLTVRMDTAGILDIQAHVGDHVFKDQILAYLADPYEGDILKEVKAPCDGTILFARDEPMVYSSMALFKIVKRE